MLENRPQILLELAHSNEHIISAKCDRMHRCNYNTKSQNQTIKKIKVGKQTSRREKTNVGRVSVRLNAEACVTRRGRETW